ncbi:MAG: hypothetical protein AB8G15_01940 [Saprospiraceae bacterium]
MDKKFWTSEKLLSLTAVLISVCTFLVFLYQTNLIKKQQYMSVFPYVSIHHEGINTEDYKFLIENNGIGPAILEKITVKDKKGKIYDDVIDYLNASLTKADTIGFFYGNLSPGILVPEKEHIEVIELTDKKEESSRRLFELLSPKKIEITLVYTSIYGERWTCSNRNKTPRKQ